MMIVHNRQSNRRQLWNGKDKQQESKLYRNKNIELQTFTIIKSEDKHTATSIATCEHSGSSNISHACFKMHLRRAYTKHTQSVHGTSCRLDEDFCSIFYVTRLRPSSSRHIPPAESRETQSVETTPVPISPAQRQPPNTCAATSTYKATSKTQRSANSCATRRRGRSTPESWGKRSTERSQ